MLQIFHRHLQSMGDVTYSIIPRLIATRTLVAAVGHHRAIYVARTHLVGDIGHELVRRTLPRVTRILSPIHPRIMLVSSPKPRLGLLEEFLSRRTQQNQRLPPASENAALHFYRRPL